MENIIITGIGSIVGWLGVQKWIFPYIIQFWNWLVDNGRKNIEITKDLREIEDSIRRTNYFPYRTSRTFRKAVITVF